MLRADEKEIARPEVGRAVREHRATRDTRIPSPRHRTNRGAMVWPQVAKKLAVSRGFLSLASITGLPC
jgi:hypothetical protein